MRYEIRCCCDPDYLLGWIDTTYTGERDIAFLLPSGASVTLSWGTIRLNNTEYRALKSNETQLSLLRQIPGFIENK